jgi:crotonobetaine/carnitine-CoA ligase
VTGPTPPTLAALWRSAATRHRDRTFLTFEDSARRVTSWTYAEYDVLVRQTATWLRDAGVGPGDRVHLVLPNSPAFIAAWFATGLLGASIVPSDPRSSSRELRQHAAIARPRLVLADAEHDDLGSLTGLVQVDPDSAGPTDVGAAAPLPELPAQEPTYEAAVMFTSGTTSAPKGVVITQANYVFAAQAMRDAAGVVTEDRVLVVLPLFHANAQYYSILPAVSVGASVVLMSAFSASRFLEQAAGFEATHASLFAAPMRMILARAARPAPTTKLRHVWFAQNLAPEDYGEFSELVGCRPRQLYGMTETLPAVLTNPADDNVPESIGRCTPGCGVELRDLDSGAAVPAGSVGEICVTGQPGRTLFAGYLGDTDPLREGIFRTGDLAHQDADGRYYFEGRRGDTMKVAGENVSAAEVEAVVVEHPSVYEAAVVAAPDPVFDEVPVAFVVARRDSARPSPSELAEFCGDRLAPSKLPRRFVFVEELPRTSVGKIRKHLLDPTADGG